METIKRDAAGYYIGQWKGKQVRLPSVTTVLGLLADYSKVRAADLKRAQEFGTAVHSIVELHETRRLDYSSLLPHHKQLESGSIVKTPDLRPILDAWEKCKSDHRFKVHSVENAVCSLRHGYAGRPDVTAELEDESGGLIELKSREYNTMLEPLQTIAYLKAWNESFPDFKLTRRFFVCLRLDGTYDCREIYDRPVDHFAIFRSAIALWQWRANLCKNV